MRLWIAKELKAEDITSFLNSSINKIAQFFDNHTRLIEDCGLYIRKDDYVLCFCAPRRKELELFVVGAQNKINEKEIFEEILEGSIPFPVEYEWEDIENTEIRQHRQSPFQGFEEEDYGDS